MGVIPDEHFMADGHIQYKGQTILPLLPMPNELKGDQESFQSTNAKVKKWFVEIKKMLFSYYNLERNK